MMKARSTKRSPQDPAAGEARSDANHSFAGEDSFWHPLAEAAAANDPAGALASAMSIIGPFYHADRAWLGRYNSDLTHFWGVSDWVGPGIVSHLQEMQGVSVDVISAAHQKFLQGENVEIPDIERLPRRSRSLQAELRREGIRSTFCAPLMWDGKLTGFFGFDHVREPAAWTPADLGRLPALGRFLAALLQRSQAHTPPAAMPAGPDRTIAVSEANGLRALSIDDIIFLEAEGDYSRVHASDGRRYFERRSLRTWVAQLPRERFLRVHQSYLVNGASIERLERGARWTLHLKESPKPIPVGRAFRHTLRLHLGF